MAGLRLRWPTLPSARLKHNNPIDSFDDEAYWAVKAHPYPSVETFRTSDLVGLKKFDGKSLAGTWTLVGAGTLNSWSLIVEYEPPAVSPRAAAALALTTPESRAATAPILSASATITPTAASPTIVSKAVRTTPAVAIQVGRAPTLRPALVDGLVRPARKSRPWTHLM